LGFSEFGNRIDASDFEFCQKTPMTPPSEEEFGFPEIMPVAPQHGYRGDGATTVDSGAVPAKVTVAISREAGARGSTIGSRAAQKLGWQIYNQELLEYIAHEGAFRQNVVDNLSADAAGWAEKRLQSLLREQSLSQHPSIMDLARIILALGAQGEVVIVGRGAGCILPPASTLNVRIIAPLSDRIAYMSQWLRLTEQEAAEEVRRRDTRRAEFIPTHFHRQPGDVYQYDLILNSSLLGEDLAADLIAQAARFKAQALFPELRATSSETQEAKE
jgi:cytidylate kinase